MFFNWPKRFCEITNYPQSNEYAVETQKRLESDITLTAPKCNFWLQVLFFLWSRMFRLLFKKCSLFEWNFMRRVLEWNAIQVIKTYTHKMKTMRAKLCASWKHEKPMREVNAASRVGYAISRSLSVQMCACIQNIQKTINICRGCSVFNSFNSRLFHEPNRSAHQESKKNVWKNHRSKKNEIQTNSNHWNRTNWKILGKWEQGISDT